MDVSNVASLVKQSVDILEVIGHAVQLRRAGNRHVGLCPFHQEKTPSFQVDVENQLYYCFGCGSGGDVLSFVMRHQNISFGDALNYLAERYNIDLPERDQAGNAQSGAVDEARKERERLYEVLQAAADYFYRQLHDGAAGRIAREYLARRGLPQEVIEGERLGYALPQWDGLLRHLNASGAPAELGLSAGLLGRSSNDPRRIYDRFRNRVIFPIRDERGRIVAFGGRSLSKDSQDEPKYLNSPETPVYHKGRMLYQLGRARTECRQVRQVVLVEGYMDLLAFHARGFYRVAATLGTALTIHQVRLLSRSADEVLLAYDGDEAGERAMLRALPLFLQQELAVSRLSFPDGMDPDDFLRDKGLEGFQDLVDRRQDLGTHAILKTLDSWDGTSGGKARAASAVKPLMEEVRQPVLRAEYVRLIAERLALSEQVVEAQLRHGRTTEAPRRTEPPAAKATARRAPAGSLEEGVIRVMVNHPEFIEEVERSEAVDCFEEPKLKAIAETVLKVSLGVGEQFRASAVYDALPGSELQELFTRLMLEPVELSEMRVHMQDWLQALSLRKGKQRNLRLKEALRLADQQGDAARVREILGQIQNLCSAKKRAKDVPDNV